MGKHTPFEQVRKNALMIRAPGVSPAVAICDALVETIDLYPTLVDLCNPDFTKIHRNPEGVNLMSLLDGNASEAKPDSLSYWRNVVSVRSHTHGLIVGRHCSRKRLEPELYDIRSTAGPLQNLSSENPEIVQELRQYLPP